MVTRTDLCGAMKRILYIALFLSLSVAAFAKPGWYNAKDFIGSCESCLDSINGTILKDGDRALIVTSSGKSALYHLDSDSGLTEDSTNYRVISPDSNAGDKRWIQEWSGGRVLIGDSTIDQGDSSITGTLAWHISNASSNATAVTVLPGTYKIATNITVPSTMKLYVEKGALFSVDSGKVLTIYAPGNISASINQQIFSGSGTIEYSSPGIIYVDWYGAVNDMSTDSGDALQACFTSAESAITYSATPDVVGNPTVILPEGPGYVSSIALTIDGRVNLLMYTDLIDTSTDDHTFLTIDGTTTMPVRVRHRIAVSRQTASDWSSEDCIGVKIDDIRASDVEIIRASKFTIGAQVYATNSVLSNKFTLGMLYSNKVALDINDIGTGGKSVNDNKFYGGYLQAFTYAGTARYGVRIGSGGTYNHNNNVFFNTSFELDADGIPILINRGSNNTFYKPRFEGNSEITAQTENDSNGNIIDTSYNYPDGFSTPGLLVQNGDYSGNILIDSSYNGTAWSSQMDRTKLIFDSGYLPYASLVSPSGGNSYTHVAGMFTQASNGSLVPAVQNIKVTDTYIEMDGNNVGIGIIADTSTVKNFWAKGKWIGAYRGLIWIVCLDVNGSVLGDGYLKPNIGSDFTYNAGYFGGAYYQASARDQSGFTVADEVKSIRVIWTNINATPTGQLTNCKLYADKPATVWAGYEPGFPGAHLAYASPTAGIARLREIAYNIAPAAGSPIGWQCIRRFDTTVKVQWTATDTTGDITATTSMAADDVIGIVLDNGVVHWSTIASVTDGDTVVINDGIPAGRTAEIGAAVYTMRWKAMANL